MLEAAKTPYQKLIDKAKEKLTEFNSDFAGLEKQEKLAEIFIGDLIAEQDAPSCFTWWHESNSTLEELINFIDFEKASDGVRDFYTNKISEEKFRKD